MGSGKKQTVGYRYHIGAHMVLIQGIADRLSRIRVGDKDAWVGQMLGGRVNINAENLFGGEGREGGVVGAVDFETGGATQGRNDYLQARLGAAIPAFRGVTAAVLRQVYIGLNPYLKPWAFRIQRIHKRQDGTLQWYDAKAPIGPAWTGAQAFYFALDSSNSMNTPTANAFSRFHNAKYALQLALDRILERKMASADVRVDIMIVAWGGTPFDLYARSTMTRRDIDATDIADLKYWVGNLDAPGDYGTYFPSAVVDAPGYFTASPADADRKLFFITDGQPQIPNVPDSENSEAAKLTASEAGATVAGIADVQAYGINIDLTDTTQTAKLDNTPDDGVPVVSGANAQAIANAIDFSSFYGHMDMNPAHIIRECLTDRYWGMGYQEADIDDVSFTAAADRLYGEAMGISLLWDRQTDIQAFVDEIVRHIDAALYVSRSTGKFVLKLIRDDYNAETLPTFGEDEIERVEDYSRPAWGELINSVTVNYWDHTTGKTATLTVDDPAAVQLQGAVNGTTVQYLGFSNAQIAARAAARDLRALSTPLLSCTIYANRTAAGLNIGDCFRFEWPDLHAGTIIMRVTGMALGDGRNNRVRITCVQDVFALPEIATIVQPPAPAPEAHTALPVSPRLAIEAPYYELVQRAGQRYVDIALADSPLVGHVLAAGGRPDSAISAELYTDAGGGYDQAGAMDFAPVATLSAPASKATTSLSITAGNDLDSVRLGALAQLGNEIVRIDAVTDTTLTVGRGCLDTVPAAHVAGTAVVCFGDYGVLDETEYADGESVDVKLVTITPADVLALASAPVDTVTLDQRAYRPYPPGNLLINGTPYAPTIGGDDDLAITWAHRDRKQQTGATVIDTTAASIGPEAGTSYTLRLYKDDGLLGIEETGLTGTDYTLTVEDEMALMPSPTGLAKAWRPLSYMGFFQPSNSYDAVPQAVAYNGSLFVAVGLNWHVARSTDGINWSSVDVNLTATNSHGFKAVAYGAGLWVAVGSNGYIATSPDAVTWTNRAHGFGAVAGVNGIVFAAGKFVAVADLYVWSSPDGITWTQGAYISPQIFRAITYADGKFVIVGDSSRLWHSTDAVTWTEVTVTGITSGGLRSVAKSTEPGGAWLIGGLGRRLVRSPDLVSFTSVIPTDIFVNSTDAVYSIVYGDGRFMIAGGVAGTSQIAPVAVSFDDGQTWSAQEIQGFNNPAANCYITGGVFADDFMFVGTGKKPGRVEVEHGAYYTTMDNFWESLEGMGMFDGSTYWEPLAVAHNGSQHVAVGFNWYASRSSNALTWTGVDVNLTADSNERFYAVAWGAGLWVAVGDGGRIATSPDGATWTARTSGTTTTLNAIAYGGGLFVAVGNSQRVVSSPDGITWTLVGGTNIYVLHAIAYAGGQFVAVGESGRIGTSADGAAWTFGLLSNIRFRSLAKNPLGAWIMGREDGSILRTLNLVDFTVATVAPFRSGLDRVSAVAYGGNKWFVGGAAISTEQRAAPCLMSEDDGLTWTEVVIQGFNRTDFNSNRINAIAYNGASFLVVGQGHIPQISRFVVGSYLLPPVGALNTSMRIELESVRDGVVSWQMHDHTLVRT